MASNTGTFAVIETGGKQYMVREGETILVEKLGQIDGKISFDKVLLVQADGGAAQIGVPSLSGATVEGEVMGEKKSKKVLGMTYKAKSNRHSKYGHRQTHAVVKITKVS